MEVGLRRVVKDALIGKILIQSRPKTGEPSVSKKSVFVINLLLIHAIFLLCFSYILLAYQIIFMNVMYYLW